MLVLCQSGTSYYHKIFNNGKPPDTSYCPGRYIQKFKRVHARLRLLIRGLRKVVILSLDITIFPK